VGTGFRVSVLTIGAALVGLLGSTIARSQPLAVGDQISKTANSVRNFDWSRPTSDEIVANPNVAPGPRPHITDVGPWSIEVQSEIHAPAEYLKRPVVVDESTRAWMARWARPRPEDITPNPRTPWGTRPYLRSVGPGYAENQGDVRNYSSAAYSGPKHATRSVVAGGASNAGPKTNSLNKANSDDRSSPSVAPKSSIQAKSDAGGDTKIEPKTASAPGNAMDTKQEAGRGVATTEENRSDQTPGGAPSRDQKTESANPAAPPGADTGGGIGGTSGNGPNKPGNKPGDAVAAGAEGAGTGTGGAGTETDVAAADTKAQAGGAESAPGQTPGGAANGAAEGSPKGTTIDAKKSANQPSPGGQEGSGDTVNPDKKDASRSAGAPTKASGDASPDTKTALADRNAGPDDAPPGAGGSIADISAAIRKYLASDAQSGAVDIGGDLANTLVQLFQTTPIEELSPASRGDSGPPPAALQSEPQPLRPPIFATAGGGITLVPGRIEFSGTNPSLRGDIRPPR